MALPESGDIVKCIKGIKVKSGYKDEKDYEFKEGVTYSVHYNEAASVSINVRDDRGHVTFIENDKIYEGLVFADHFKLHKKASAVKLYTTVGIKPGKYDWDYIKGHKETKTAEGEPYIDMTDQIECVEINGLDRVEFFNTVHIIRMNGKLYPNRREGFGTNLVFDGDAIKMSKKTKSFSFSQGEVKYGPAEDDEQVFLGCIDYPDSLEKLYLLNTSSDVIETKAKSIELVFSEVGNLLVDPKTIENLWIKKTKIYSCNLEFFVEKLNGCKTPVTTFKIDDNTFLSSMRAGRLNMKRISTVYNTLQLHKTIKHFGLDPNSKYEFIPEYDSDKHQKNKYHDFHGDYDNKKKLVARTYRNEIMLYKSKKVLYTLSKKDTIKVYIDSHYFNHTDDVALSNNVFNRIAKFSEHEQLPPLFFDDLFRNPVLEYTKSTGLVDVRDFDFSMMDTCKEYEGCEVIYYEGGEWRWKMCVKGGRDYDRTSSGKIDWTNIGFELSTKDVKDGSYYVRPGIENYWKATKDVQDLYHLIHNELDWVEYDESVTHTVPSDPNMVIEEETENDHIGGFLHAGSIYFNMDGREGTDHRGWQHRYSVPLSEAEAVAKKYKFKLKPGKVEANRSSKYGATYSGFMKGYNDHGDNKCNKRAIMNYVFSKEHPILNDRIIQRTDSPYVMIGDGVYYKDHYCGSTGGFKRVGGYDLDPDTPAYQREATNDVKDLLIKNNYRFSLVNIDVPTKLRTDVLNFIEKYRDILYYGFTRGANQKLPGVYYLIAYSFDRWPMKHFYRDENEPKVTKKMEEEWLSLKTQMRVCFDKTLKRVGAEKTSKKKKELKLEEV